MRTPLTERYCLPGFVAESEPLDDDQLLPPQPAGHSEADPLLASTSAQAAALKVTPVFPLSKFVIIIE